MSRRHAPVKPLLLAGAHRKVHVRTQRMVRERPWRATAAWAAWKPGPPHAMIGHFLVDAFVEGA